MTLSKLQAAIDKFDALNAQDPNTVLVNKKDVPKELHNAKAMTRWVNALYPDAPEPVLLAARCQHLCRWEIPRNSYPEGRVAYLKWRKRLQQFHADKSEAVLREVGYDEEVISEVRDINLKKELQKHPNTQAIEDALCMVFMEQQLESYATKWEEEKTIRILQKTWNKMSQKAQEAALKLPLSEQVFTLINKALATESNPCDAAS